MNKFLFLFIGLVTCNYTYSQDNSVSGYCYNSNGGVFLKIASELQGTTHLGGSERFEIEISGGAYGDFGKHIYMIDARNGLNVVAHQLNENVDGYNLKVFDNGNPSSSSGKYVLGIETPAGPWLSICVRARELNNKVWLDVIPSSTSGLTEVQFQTQWLFKANSDSFVVENFEVSSQSNVGVTSTYPASGHHSFVGKYSHGIFSNWLNSGVPATAYNLIGYSDRHAGFGVASGDNIVSPIVWMYDYQGLNAFMVRTMAFEGDMTSGKDLFIVRSNGNVGVGTTVPDSKLTVAGKVHAQEVQVTVNAGADFVFEEGYELTSLEELDQYVKENNHLPEIASAKEMESEGIHLAEMNIMLLQKIEELTLHLIEQNKKMIEKDQQVNQLSNQLNKVNDRLIKLENQ